MIGVFNEWGPRDKATKLKIDGKWIWPKRGLNMDGIEPGQRVEFEFNYGGSDGKLPILQKIRPAPASNGAAPSQQGVACEVSPLDGEGMRWISNVLGSALRGGQIKEPHEVTAWAVAGYRALRSVRSLVSEPELNDPIDREPGSDDERENPAPAGTQW
jgi:hypothetical protein